MYVALYKSSAGTWLDGAINAFSGFGGFSHVELVFNAGDCFSSTSRDTGVYRDGRPKPDGCRWKVIDFDANPARWHLYRLAATPAEEAIMRAAADDILDARYDFWACARFVCPLIGEHPDAYMCSEAVVTVLQSAGYLTFVDQPYAVSPNGLAEILGVIRA